MTQIFKKGDTVTWASQASGTKRTKTGKVVATGQPGQSVRDALRCFSLEMINFVPRVDSQFGAQRDAFVLVSVPHEGKGRPRLYKPRLKGLQKTTPAVLAA